MPITPTPPQPAAQTPAPVVLVTGAAKRLGREIALALAQAGYRVAVHYRQSALDAAQTVADCNQHTPGSAAFACDLEDESAVRALLPEVARALGQVDAVVNSASTFEHDDAHTLDYAQLARHMRCNVGAPVLLAQALHAHASARSANAVVVNLLDQKLWNPNPDFLSYTLSKAALESATTTLALALSPLLRVVGVAPGLTLTSPWLQGERFAAAHKLSPLGRSSTAQDVARTVLFALQNQSITGTTLLVDGGQHLMRFERDFSLM